MLADSEIRFVSEKVHAHRWPQDSPAWDDPARSLIDGINGTRPGQVIVRGTSVTVKDVEFHSVGKVGVSVPPFKRECTMIFEAKFGGFSAHVHITARSDDYAGIFGRLASWRDSNLL